MRDELGPVTGSIRPAAAATSSGVVSAAPGGAQTIDCRRAAGRLQVRILEARSDGQGAKTVPEMFTETFGALPVPALDFSEPAAPGKHRGLPGNGGAALKRDEIAAENAQLAAAGCPSFDLEKAFARSPNGRPPRPIIPAPKTDNVTQP